MTCPNVYRNPVRLLLAICLFAGSLAGATTYRELDLDSLLQKAQIAFYGEVREVSVEDRDGEPWTRVRFEVRDDLFAEDALDEVGDGAAGDGSRDNGEEGEGSSRELLFYGGELPGLTLNVTGMPQFSPGDEVIILAYDADYYSPIVGFNQGLWRLGASGFRDPQGRILSLGPDSVLVRDGAGAGTADLVRALQQALEEARP